MASISAALQQDLKSLRQYTTETAMDACTTTSAVDIMLNDIWVHVEAPRMYDFVNHPPEPYCWMN